MAAIYTHDGLVLYSTEEKFYAAGEQPSEVLEIDRINFELRLINSLPPLPPTTPRRSISAIVGIIHLLAGPYLLVVTEKQKVGELEGHAIWEVKGSDVIPFTKTNIHLNEQQAKDNREYISLVQQALATPGYYFSHRYDLSHSQQRLHNGMESKPNFAQLSLHERGDERFIWNAHVLRDLAVQPELRRFVVPLIHGFVAIKNVTVNGKTFTFALVSRRNWHRAGTRYFVRGLDTNGNAANYVETEQMIWYSGQVASYVQTRGSIPLLWSQTPNIKYKPTPAIHTSPTTGLAVQRHLDEQIALYGRQVLVNLIDQKGKEKKIGETFARQIANYNNGLVRYLHFDFHKECSKMRWDRLALLMNQLDQDQISFGYFFQNGKGSAEAHQGGVFRVNCMDSLDRTNVVQSMLARRMLQKQLLRMRVISLTERVQDKVELEKTFKKVWADNADYCSIQYAGTGALKTDFTRTGKRTYLGAVKDGVNSATRYYYNNFADGFRQDAMDLFLGVHVVSRDEGVTIPSVLQQPRSLRLIVLPLILVFSLAMLFIILLLGPASEGSYQMTYMLFWAAALVFTLLYIVRHGTEFVNTPRFSADPFAAKKGL